MAIDLKQAHEEFAVLKSEAADRNYEYYLLRQAVKGNFRWPRNWPTHIPRYKRNLCRRISRQHVTYLMGKGFTFNVNRPNTLEFRESAERTEKILRQLLVLSKGELQLLMGALNGSQLGRSIFKVYKKGDGGAKHACFSYCQPDYFYGVPKGDNHLDGFSVVYYSYPLDIDEAKRVFGPGDYKTEGELANDRRYADLADRRQDRMRGRRVPVLEIWTPDSYALEVGGVTKHNGDNPYKWSNTKKGFIPFVVIENSRNSGEGVGEADIVEARELNEVYNQLFSLKHHIIQRWLRPTIVWEGAPQNYGEVLANTMNGGGAISTRLGSRLYFLVHDRPNQAVNELEQETRAAILESAGMTEIALQGIPQGAINTGPSVSAQFAPQLSSVDMKRIDWTNGLRELFAMLLQVQEDIGASTALGEAVINQTRKSENNSDGKLVKLSGKDINGLRDVSINWPGVLPKDNIEAARFEMEKMNGGLQSLYTTLEKLGEDYPDDEIARVRMENQDPWLRGEKVAEQIRAQTPLLKAQADDQFRQQQFASEENQRLQQSLAELTASDIGRQQDQSDLAQRIRQASRSTAARMDDSGDEPVIAAGAGY